MMGGILTLEAPYRILFNLREADDVKRGDIGKGW